MAAHSSGVLDRDIRCRNIRIEEEAQKFGELEDSSSLLDDQAALRARMAQDGYLFFRGLLDTTAVLQARRAVTDRLARLGLLAADTDPLEAIASESMDGQLQDHKFMPEKIAHDNPSLHQLLYSGRLMRFFEHFLGEPVKHFDYTWFRSHPPGAAGTPPHCDVVFMGRGEQHRLYTAWTPIGDIDFRQGGLMVLEGSNRIIPSLRRGYATQDVDTFCENSDDKRDHWEKGTRGILSWDPVELRNTLGGRWLTTEYRAGDVLIFTVFTVHASLDNRSDRVRLSSDSRYQPAAARLDHRWVGANPVGHGPGSKRGLIC